MSDKTYAHDAHCNTIHEAGPDPCPPERDADAGPDLLAIREAIVVRPGDTLVVRVNPSHGWFRSHLDELAHSIKERLPGIEVLIVTADQLVIYRPEDKRGVELVDRD